MKNLSFVFIFFCFVHANFAQISHGGRPLKLQQQKTFSSSTFINTNTDVSALIEEDKITDLHKDIAWRFGKVIPTNLNLNNSGNWQTLSNGDRVWTLTITSPTAISLNLNFSHFYLPDGASFFVYNKKTILGAFTKENNKINGEFATSPLAGDAITLEYYEPASVTAKGIIDVSSIVHGYRDLFKQLKAFKGSGTCNINVACEKNYWNNETRSVVMILTVGNSRFCSGALINNTSQDGTPYVLTAQHCFPSSNNIFMFNYQSPTCDPNTDGPTTETINGCTLIANDSPSDFHLIQLSSTPPLGYNVFYAGWSAINTTPSKGTAIHHPRGDTKKISQTFDSLVNHDASNSFWRVPSWEKGTTESGSSGSPLFDQNHRIVGQLKGGSAACGNEGYDFFGKFAISWAANADITKQLKNWLDPTNTGIMTINGYNPNSPLLANDAVLLNVAGIESYFCGNSITPTITIQNNGSANLTSLTISYLTDGVLSTPINWTGNLASYQIENISLPTISISNGDHDFTVLCTNPNGGPDENILNNAATIEFKSNDTPLYTTLNLTTDNFGEETSWLILDQQGNKITKSKGYPNTLGGSSYTENLCLYEACFDFILKDSYGDGFCCLSGNGSVLLTEDATMNTLVTDNTFSGSSITYSFCTGNATGIREEETPSFSIYPNPNNGNFTISSPNNIEKITLINVLGKIVYRQENIHKNVVNINLSSVNKGIYFVSMIIDGQQQKTTKVILR